MGGVRFNGKTFLSPFLSCFPIMKTALPICLLLCLASPWSGADTVKLKSGETFEGKVVWQSPEELVMRVGLSAGVSDEKTFPMTEVESVSKTPPDEEAFAQLPRTALPASALDPSAYAAQAAPLEGFLALYPQSAHAAEVKARLDEVQAEAARVKAGEVKRDGRWYAGASAQRARYQMEAELALRAMKAQAARRDWVGALKAFGEIEKKYAGAVAFPEALQVHLGVLRAALAEAGRLKTLAPTQEAQFQKGLAKEPEPRRGQLLAAHKAEVAAAQQAYRAAEKEKPQNRPQWPPFSVWEPRSLDAFKTAAEKELARAAKLPLEAMRQSIAAAQKAGAALEAKDEATAAASLQEAEKLWPQNRSLEEVRENLSRLTGKPVPAPGEPGKAPQPQSTPAPKPWYYFNLF